MITRKLSAGDIIEAACTRCRTIFNHTIVAMVGERVVRVQCNTCGGTHNYRKKEEESKAPKSGTTRTATRSSEPSPRKSKADPHAAEREEWESLVPAMDKNRAIPYDMAAKFSTNDLIQHPVFGLGLVKALSGPQKMEVLFQAGKKLLRCK